MSRKVSSFNLLTGIDLTGDRIPILDMSSTGRARSRLVLPQTLLDELISPLLNNFVTNSQTGQFYPISNPSGFSSGISLSGYATEVYVNNASGAINNKIITINSGTGNFVQNSQTGQFYPSSNPSGFITSINLTGYATQSYVDNISGEITNRISNNIEFLPNVSSLTGGTSLCLDGISTSGYIAGKKVVSFVYSGVPFQLKHYFLVNNISGQYTGDGNGIIVPTGDLNKVWISL